MKPAPMRTDGLGRLLVLLAAALLVAGVGSAAETRAPAKPAPKSAPVTRSAPATTHINIPARRDAKAVELEPESDDEEVAEFVRLVNEYRRRKGCPVLLWDSRLARVAEAHSEDMAKRGYFAHTNPDGLKPHERLRKAGITYSRMGENLAVGQRTAREVLDAWLASPDHRHNIEDCAYTHHGVGFYKNHWTHLFLTPPYRER